VTPELCDALDNDCDGAANEGFGLGQTCHGLGQCGEGERECNGSGGAQCSSAPGGSTDQSSAEVCDGLDNDCDGLTDEQGICGGGVSTDPLPRASWPAFTIYL
jgi:hypothetical protein